MSSEQALKELGLNEHQLRFTCRVQLHDPHSDPDTLRRIYTHLKRSVRKFLELVHHKLLSGMYVLCLEAKNSFAVEFKQTQDACLLSEFGTLYFIHSLMALEYKFALFQDFLFCLLYNIFVC